jgi:hypothetical protein
MARGTRREPTIEGPAEIPPALFRFEPAPDWKMIRYHEQMIGIDVY